MSDWLVIVILGIIEGVTEFIPVSSTGHLLLVQQWLPAQSGVFNIVIQCGAALALVPLFYRQITGMLLRFHEPENRDLFLKLSVAFILTCIGGLAMKMLGMELPDTALPVAWAVFIGGIAMLAVEFSLRGRKLSDEVTWKIAVIIGLAQLLAAAFPGASRSGSTIVIALMLGLNRTKATEFSFLLGIPTLLAAGVLELWGELKDKPPGAPSEDWGMLLLGTVVSAIVSFIVVKWLIRFVQSHTFNGFALYRIIIGAILLIYFLPGR